MDRSSEFSILTGLATASSFLCAVVSSAFGLTDAFCGSGECVAEFAAALVSGAAFLHYLA